MTRILIAVLMLALTPAQAHTYKNCPKIWWKTHKGSGFVTIWGGFRDGRGGYEALYVTATKKRRQLDATKLLVDRSGRFKGYLLIDEKRFTFRFECV